LEDRHNQKVSLSTIIDRAKKNDFYLKKRSKKDAHDREVLTNYVGEMIQHSSLSTCGRHLPKKNGISSLP
jgi:hypothetical protein